MARPNVREERREQILDAYETCVARFGVEGASLEKVARQAGLARPLIRHNVGNRDDLLGALVDRFVSRSEQSVADMIAALPPESASETLVDYLFDPALADPQLVLVAEALIAAGQNDPNLADRMRDWTEGFVAAVQSVLSDEYPQAKATDLDAVAAGLTGIYFNIESLTPLGPATGIRNASKRAARLLLGSLEAGS